MLKRAFYLFILFFFAINNLYSKDDEKEQKDTITLSAYERSGGYARLWSMGSENWNLTYNYFIIDPFYIVANPAWSSKYYNFLWGDLGSTIPGNDFDGSPQFAGFNFKIQDGLILGAILSRRDFHGGSIYSVDRYTLASIINANRPGPSVIVPTNNLSFVGSYELETDFSLGFGLSYSSSFNENKPAGSPTASANFSQFGLTGGALYKQDELLVDASASIVFLSADSKAPNVRTYEGSASLFNLFGRVFYEYNNNLTFVGVLFFNSASGETVDKIFNGTSTKRDLDSRTGYGLSAGINYRHDRFLLAGGVTYACSTITAPKVANVSPELTNSICYFPIWNLGLEYLATNWLILRCGYYAGDYSQSVETAASPTTKNLNEIKGYVPGSATLGLGFRFGTFGLDAAISEQVLREGLNLIGGGKQTFAYISASYAF